MRALCGLLVTITLAGGCGRNQPAPDANSPFSSEAARLEHEKLQARLRELRQAKPGPEKPKRVAPEVTTAAVTNPVSPDKEAELRQTIAQHEQSLGACEIQLRAVRAASPAHANKLLRAIADIRASMKRIKSQLDRHEDAAVVEREVATLMQQFSRLQATAQQGLR